VKRMRLLVIMLVIWLILFYSVERLSEPINISRIAYPFAPLMAVFIILVPRLHKAPLWALLVAPIPVFLALKAWKGYRVWGTAIPLTVTEICAIAVTTILAYWVSKGVSEFEHAIVHITIGQADELPVPFSTGQAEMYREVKRARHHQRPLALMAIGVEKESIQVALDRMVQEVQQVMMKRYVLSEVARTLCDELEDYNVIAQSNDHFLVLLPEVTPEGVGDLACRLRKAVYEQVGITLRLGTASFPKDTVTFESLVERAVEDMEKGEPVPSAQSRRLTTESHATQ
jgi:GGDEF domain-containing protein